MKKIIITFKEPIRVDNDMRYIITVEQLMPNYESTFLVTARHNGVIVYLPISNILGMSVEKEN